MTDPFIPVMSQPNDDKVYFSKVTWADPAQRQRADIAKHAPAASVESLNRLVDKIEHGHLLSLIERSSPVPMSTRTYGLLRMIVRGNAAVFFKILRDNVDEAGEVIPDVPDSWSVFIAGVMLLVDSRPALHDMSVHIVGESDDEEEDDEG